MEMRRNPKQPTHERAPRADIGPTLVEPAEFSVKHFSDEARFMESIDHPGLHTHRLVHEGLVSSLLGHKAAFDSGGDLTEEFFQFLEPWLSGHMRGVDMKYTRHANSVGT